MTIAAGARFDRYEILTHLGSGGMGEVYLARDSRLERKIAIKLLPAEFTRDQARLLRFETEAKAASGLNHPNIITIHEIGESSSRHFITTEFIEGRTLRQVIAAGKLPALPAIDIGSQIASALAAAHQAGIIHRDVKPENVMIRPDGIVKVLDFGLAKLTERCAPESDSEAPTAALINTEPGMILGTATYMSPEQVRALRVDARTDIFSLGVVMFEMLTGRTPFEGSTSVDVMSQVLNKDPGPLSSYTSGVPLELQRIVNKSLRKDREERYQTVKDLLLDLKSLKRELETTSTLGGYAGAAAHAETSRQTVNYETVFIPNAKSAEMPAPRLRVSKPLTILEKPEAKKRRRMLALLGVVGTLLLVSLAFYFLRRPDVEIEAIAVLPFAATTADPETQTLSDAISDSIINNLSKLPNLKVKSRNAVRQYQSADADITKIGKDLDVDAVLTGNIGRRGDDLTINVALVNARENVNLWGERYNRKISDLVLIQQNITHDVSEKLRIRLSGDEKRKLDAYQLYLKGRNEWSKRTSQSIKEGLNYFEEAVKLDPTSAPAYAGLADCYNMLGNYSISPPKESFPKAKIAAEKALSLDDGLAEAHAARAYTYFNWEWNWSEAEREFLRAMELKSDYGPASQWYASLLMATGKPEAALSMAKRAHDLELFSLVVSSHYGWINYLARRYDVAIAETTRLLKIDPGSYIGHRYLALAYEVQGKYDLAFAEFDKAVPLSRGSIILKAELGHAYAVSGKKDQAIAVLNELRQLSNQRYISPFHLALIHTGLGEKDAAIEWLNTAYNERSERLVWIGVDPRFDVLRSDVRFKDLLSRIGLPERP
jgi:eukaryotic-like serine/threonine-protein kinase